MLDLVKLMRLRWISALAWELRLPLHVLQHLVLLDHTELLLLVHFIHHMILLPRHHRVALHIVRDELL
jgi:hypothetical protein